MNLYYPGMEFEFPEDGTPIPTDREVGKAIEELFQCLWDNNVFEEALLDLFAENVNVYVKPGRYNDNH